MGKFRAQLVNLVSFTERFLSARSLLRRILRFPLDSFFLLFLVAKKLMISRGVPKNRVATQIPAAFINIEHRLDRRIKFEKQMGKLPQFEFTRTAGVVDVSPLFGCAESHVLSIERLIDSESIIGIFEDDAEFVGNARELSNVISEFSMNPLLDVLVLSPSHYGISIPISSRLAVSNQIRTTAAYLLKPRAALLVRSRFQWANQKLSEGQPETRFALDVAWRIDQRFNLLFAAPRERLFKQSESYSDIQHREVDYR